MKTNKRNSVTFNRNMKTRNRIPTALITAALLTQLALPAADTPAPRPNGKPADMTKKVKVFILLGQSNMVGMGKIKGGEGSLENAVKEKKKYPYLVDEAGNWVERQDVRYMTEELPVKTILDARPRLVAGAFAVVRDAHLAEDVFQKVPVITRTMSN